MKSLPIFPALPFLSPKWYYVILKVHHSSIMLCLLNKYNGFIFPIYSKYFRTLKCSLQNKKRKRRNGYMDISIQEFMHST